jgi:hypothetical protein
MVGVCTFDRSGRGVGEGRHRERRRREGRVSEQLRAAHRALSPCVHRLVVRAVELVERELDHQIHGLG